MQFSSGQQEIVPENYKWNLHTSQSILLVNLGSAEREKSEAIERIYLLYLGIYSLRQKSNKPS